MTRQKTLFLGLRLDAELLKRLDEHVDRVRAETGFGVGRSDVVRKLLSDALDRVEGRRKKG
jgi:metal-responsive CopG/Arc/MetJ family transcriptional regulator